MGKAGLRLLGAALTLLLVAGTGLPPLSPPPTPLTTAPLTDVSIPPAASTCEAQSLAWLVGRPRSQIPVPVDPSRRRVACDSCPVTQDFRPERTNILFDANTDIVTAVTCG
jgi:hypothetical protein